MKQKCNLYFAFKIMDGLFIGDYNSIKEKDFLLQNKILNIVNCAATQMQPNNLTISMNFLNFSWLDVDDQIILDSKDENINLIFEFLSSAIERGEGSLICSVRGQSRSLTVLTAFIMKRYLWSLYKALEFMNSKRSDFEIRAAFLQQLLSYDARLQDHLGSVFSKSWADPPTNGESLLIQNTFLNSQLGLFRGIAQEIKVDRITLDEFQLKQRITWANQLTSIIGDSQQKQQGQKKQAQNPQRNQIVIAQQQLNQPTEFNQHIKESRNPEVVPREKSQLLKNPQLSPKENDRDNRQITNNKQESNLDLLFKRVTTDYVTERKVKTQQQKRSNQLIGQQITSNNLQRQLKYPTMEAGQQSQIPRTLKKIDFLKLQYSEDNYLRKLQRPTQKVAAASGSNTPERVMSKEQYLKVQTRSKSEAIKQEDLTELFPQSNFNNNSWTTSNPNRIDKNNMGYNNKTKRFVQLTSVSNQNQIPSSYQNFLNNQNLQRPIVKSQKISSDPVLQIRSNSQNIKTKIFYLKSQLAKRSTGYGNLQKLQTRSISQNTRERLNHTTYQ